VVGGRSDEFFSESKIKAQQKNYRLTVYELRKSILLSLFAAPTPLYPHHHHYVFNEEARRSSVCFGGRRVDLGGAFSLYKVQMLLACRGLCQASGDGGAFVPWMRA
jgi:hypothetical protein